MGKYNSRKRKTKKNIPAGEVHIHSTFNNTIVTITDLEGNVVSWASAGTQGVKGSKKSTPFAAGMAAEAAGREATAAGMKTVNVKVKGLGSGREAAIRSLQTVGFKISISASFSISPAVTTPGVFLVSLIILFSSLA